MMRTVFDFTSYKEYLLFREQTWPARGFRLGLANATSCKAPYITLVLNEDTDLSSEQGALCHEFLGHNPVEAHFFMLLLSKDRAGTSRLKEYYQTQIESLRKERESLQGRLQDQKLEVSVKDLDQYYDSHVHAFVHMAVTIAELNTVEKIAKRLNLSLEAVRSSLEFLCRIQLVSERAGKYKPGKSRIHLRKDHRFTNRHHKHLRIKCLDSIDVSQPQDLHYSSVLTYAESDIPQIRKILVDALEKIQEVVKDSPSDDLFVLTADSFRLK